MEERLSARKLDLEYLRFWGVDSGFHDPWLLLLVPAPSHGSVLLCPQGQEGPAGCPTGCDELSLLLDGIWMALPTAGSFDLYGLDCRQANFRFRRSNDTEALACRKPQHKPGATGYFQVS